MRKAYLLLAIILLACMIPTPVLAASLRIDDQHIYEGMDRTYLDGYIPQVEGGIATIILPLIGDGDKGEVGIIP